MTTLLDQIPGEVLLRHTCHCDAAVEKPAPHEHDEHVFQVDGQDFPWHISERGPIVTHVADDLYKINVEIFLITGPADHAAGKPVRALPIGYTAPGMDTPPDGPGPVAPYIPLIDGQQFPWLCDDSPMQISFSHKQLPTLNLTFYARNVTGNYPIGDQRGDDEVQWCAGGSLIKDGNTRCHWCNTLVPPGDGLYTALYDHIEQQHPERVRPRADGQKSYDLGD